MSGSIQVTCKGAGTMDQDRLVPLQDDLKSLTKQNYKRLRKEILELGFSEPISVWTDPTDAKVYVLNGHQRLKVVRRMIEVEGVSCPPLPVNFVQAADLKEARRKILALASQYGQVNSHGLAEFMALAEIDLPEMKESFHFPDLDMPAFETEHFDGEPPDLSDKKRKMKLIKKVVCPNCKHEFEA